MVPIGFCLVESGARAAPYFSLADAARFLNPRLGRTGEVTNKIGTYTKAVLAARHGIPFYVAIPLSTIDWRLADPMVPPNGQAEGRRAHGIELELRRSLGVPSSRWFGAF